MVTAIPSGRHRLPPVVFSDASSRLCRPSGPRGLRDAPSGLRVFCEEAGELGAGVVKGDQSASFQFRFGLSAPKSRRTLARLQCVRRSDCLRLGWRLGGVRLRCRRLAPHLPADLDLVGIGLTTQAHGAGCAGLLSRSLPFWPRARSLRSRLIPGQVVACRGQARNHRIPSVDPISVTSTPSPWLHRDQRRHQIGFAQPSS